MLGLSPHSADIGREPTSVAYIYKEESMHQFVFNRQLLPILVVLQFPPALASDFIYSSLILNVVARAKETTLIMESIFSVFVIQG